MNTNNWKKVKSLISLSTNDSWKEFMKNNEDKLNNIKNILDHDDNTIYPEPKLIFNALNKVSLKDIRVLIVGQDCYHGAENGIPQAMGLSFSVPNDISIPSSLRNIFKNQLNFNHIKKMPLSGDLTKWANQGCLMLNSALTVQAGKPGSHMKHWEDFTNVLIKYISDNTNNIVFLLWGSHALSKIKFIDSDKHKIVISSHPSGLSCDKPMKQYGAFKDVDHFGMANQYLIEYGKSAIDWN